MSILDAMGYGLPVVSTNVGGIPKIVHNGENGVCCDAGDIDTMADGIISLLKDNEKRCLSSKASVEIIKKGYTLDAHIKLVEKVYEGV